MSYRRAESTQGIRKTRRPVIGKTASTLVILFNSHPSDNSIKHLSEIGKPLLLFSLDGNRPSGNLLERCEVLVADVQRHLRQGSIIARKKYTKFIARWPQEFKVGSKSFREALTVDGLSLSWITEFSMKNNELYSGFYYLALLEALRLVIKETGLKRAVILGSKSAPIKVLAEALASEGLKVDLLGADVEGVRTNSLWRSLLLTRSAFFIRALAWTALAKFTHLWLRYRLPSHFSGSVGSCSLAFFTLYPERWEGDQDTLERKWLSLPHYLSKVSKQPYFYAASFSADGVHESTSIRQYVSLCFKYAQDVLGGWKKRLYLVDADLRFSDVLVSFFHPAMLRHARILMSKAFRESLVYEGINIYPLLYQEVARSLWRTPMYFLNARRIRRFLEANRVEKLFLLPFEYCFGRALIAGGRAANQPTTLIGMQHGGVMPMGLYYSQYHEEICPADQSKSLIHCLPLPDKILLYGPLAFQILKASSYPKKILQMTGGSRFDELAEFVQRQDYRAIFQNLPFHVPGNLHKVLVLGGLHDSQPLCRILGKGLGHREDIFLILRPHPLSVDRTKLAAHRHLEKLQNIVITMHPLWELIAISDVVITGYTSAAIEALALSKPTICVQTFNGLDLTPFFDYQEACLHAGDGLSLNEALNQALDGDKFWRLCGDQARQLVQDHFYFLDGKAKERIAQAVF